MSKTKFNRIEQYTVDKIKEAANILDIVGDFVDLRKDGNYNYEGLCPFHDDRHIGSFKVSPRRNLCKCFSCGKSYYPIDFLMNVNGGMPYYKALRYIASKYGIPIQDEEPMQVPKAVIRPKPEPLPVKLFPIDYAKGKMNPQGNTLIEYLHSLPWSDEDRQTLDILIRYYAIGTMTTGTEKGWTIFWQIDAEGNIRDGKIMKYLPNGHRDKTMVTTKEGKQKPIYSFNWISSKLQPFGMYDPKTHDIERCLFGLHLVDAFPDATIFIVESEKTALIAATNAEPGRQLFMATAGKGNLCRTLLQPLIDRERYIRLVPDHDAYDEWQRIAEQMDYERITVSNVCQTQWTEEDGPKADIGDIIIRLLHQPKPIRQSMQERLLASMIEKNPAIQTLIDKLDLQIVQ